MHGSGQLHGRTSEQVGHERRKIPLSALGVRSGDPRVDVQSALAMLAPQWGFRQLIDIDDAGARENLARASVMALSFVAQSARGIGQPPVFTCARTAGWSAQIMEQKREGRLIRPTAKYVGPPPRPLSDVRSARVRPGHVLGEHPRRREARPQRPQ